MICCLEIEKNPLQSFFFFEKFDQHIQIIL